MLTKIDGSMLAEAFSREHRSAAMIAGEAGARLKVANIRRVLSYQMWTLWPLLLKIGIVANATACAGVGAIAP